MNDRSANVFSLFASTSTLLCCALPALFVALGAGASFATLLSVFPFLIVVSQYKIPITVAALAMISLAGYTHYRTARLPCPADPELGPACLRSRVRSRYIYYLSILLFIFASLFTYVVPKVI